MHPTQLVPSPEDVVVAMSPGLQEGSVSRLGQPPPGGRFLRNLASRQVVISPVLNQAWEAHLRGTEHASPAGGSRRLLRRVDVPPRRLLLGPSGCAAAHENAGDRCSVGGSGAHVKQNCGGTPGPDPKSLKPHVLHVPVGSRMRFASAWATS